MVATCQRSPSLERLNPGSTLNSTNHKQRSVRYQVRKDRRVGSYDVLGLTEAGPRLEQSSDQLKPAGVYSVLRFFKSYQCRGFLHPCQRQEPKRTKRTLRKNSCGYGDAAFLKTKFDLAQVAHFDLNPVDVGHHCMQRLLNGVKLPGVQRFQRIEKCRKFLTHQT